MSGRASHTVAQVRNLQWLGRFLLRGACAVCRARFRSQSPRFVCRVLRQMLRTFESLSGLLVGASSVGVAVRTGVAATTILWTPNQPLPSAGVPFCPSRQVKSIGRNKRIWRAVNPVIYSVLSSAEFFDPTGTTAKAAATTIVKRIVFAMLFCDPIRRPYLTGQHVSKKAFTSSCCRTDTSLRTPAPIQYPGRSSLASTRRLFDRAGS